MLQIGIALAHMFVLIRTCCKSSRAPDTGERFLSYVSSHVIRQSAALIEHSVAQSTFVWGFVGVSSHVSCQIAVLCERLDTYCALTLLGVHF